jgi:hypothetical protein
MLIYTKTKQQLTIFNVVSLRGIIIVKKIINRIIIIIITIIKIKIIIIMIL